VREGSTSRARSIRTAVLIVIVAACAAGLMAVFVWMATALALVPA
jgi:hypothetical protein